MTEQKEKVVSGLECCTQKDMCEQCPYVGQHQCGHFLKCDVLFIIRKQEKRIEELTVRNDELCDTVRKFAERLKTYFKSISGTTSPILTAYHIDQIAKEIIGGDSNA